MSFDPIYWIIKLKEDNNEYSQEALKKNVIGIGWIEYILPAYKNGDFTFENLNHTLTVMLGSKRKASPAAVQILAFIQHMRPSDRVILCIGASPIWLGTILLDNELQQPSGLIPPNHILRCPKLRFQSQFGKVQSPSQKKTTQINKS